MSDPAVPLPDFTKSVLPAPASSFEKHTFTLPVKRVHDVSELPRLFSSTWFVRFSAFVLAVRSSVVGKPRSATLPASPAVTALLSRLTAARAWVEEIPPIQQPQRFGNAAFRQWHARLAKEAEQWVIETVDASGVFSEGFATRAPSSEAVAAAEAVATAAASTATTAAPTTRHPAVAGHPASHAGTRLPSSFSASRAPIPVGGSLTPQPAAPVTTHPGPPCTLAAELAGVLLASFGNPGRLDYGTGHEMTFIAFLAALAALGVFTESDYAAVGAAVFSEYLIVARGLQRTYWLEPAGSKGAWGLDDYQFLPFLWGSAQIWGSSSNYPTPAAARSSEADGEKEGEFLLLDAVRFVCSVKTGPLAVHSPYMAQIFDVPEWELVVRGLGRMYSREVLVKFPVMQHTLFGSVLGFEPAPKEQATAAAVAMGVEDMLP